jgi:hypothetical protein
MDSEILTCPVDDFFVAYMPFIPSDESITQCAEHLVDAGFLSVGQNDTFAWRGFEPPTQTQEPETKAFNFLTSITSVIGQQKFSATDQNTGPSSESRVRYEGCPNSYIFSEIEGADFKIDGRFRLKNFRLSKTGDDNPKRGAHKMATNQTKKVAAPDTVVIAEYKKKTKDPNATLDVSGFVLSTSFPN